MVMRSYKKNCNHANLSEYFFDEVNGKNVNNFRASEFKAKLA